MAQTAPLPQFRRPPVVEVALSIMFDRLEKFSSAHVGLFWSKVRSQFPKTVDQAPLEFLSEHESESRETMPQSFKIETVQVPKLRTWFLSDDDTQLLQIQSDRLTRNWRSATADYPRYPSVRQPFESDVTDFGRFLVDNNLGVLTPRQCEITYVNHIRTNSVWSSQAEVAKVFTNWQDLAGGFLPQQPEDARFACRYIIRRDGRFAGRLHVVLQPAFLSATPAAGDIIFVLSLTARGEPLGAGIEGALGFLDLGHEWIVRGFAQLTTPAMHTAWERVL